MKTTNSENKVACLGVLGGATAVLLAISLFVVLSGVWVYRTFTSAASDFNRSPFAGAQNTRPYVRPANVYLDLQTIPVRDNSDTSDEKVILKTIEAKLRTSQAPVFQATWLRLVTGQNPQRCTFTYFRDDMHLQYEVAGQPNLTCQGVTFADFMGMAHGVGSSITQDMTTLTNRNARVARRN